MSEGSLCVVIVNILNCDILVSDFKTQYTFTFGLIPL